jgi:hypothetical protein
LEKLTLGGLLELFGRAFMAKFQEAPTKSQIPGKHFGKHHECEFVHPPTTKIVRSFIRGSGRESTYNRQLYARLTGHQYKGEKV